MHYTEPQQWCIWSHWSYRKELSSREKLQKQYLNSDPASSKRITGALFQLVSLRRSYWHPERKENSCKHCTASCCTRGSMCRLTADYKFTKFTLKSDRLRPTHYIWQKKYEHPIWLFLFFCSLLIITFGSCGWGITDKDSTWRFFFFCFESHHKPVQHIVLENNLSHSTVNIHTQLLQKSSHV